MQYGTSTGSSARLPARSQITHNAKKYKKKCRFNYPHYCAAVASSSSNFASTTQYLEQTY
jgi:hypothetical protein